MFDLSVVITSKTRLAVLTLFITNPTLELGVRETARKLEVNPMLARHELILLQTAGLLKSRRVANSIQFSLDANCPAIPPFKQLISMDDGKSSGAENSPTENTIQTSEMSDDE